MLGNLLQLCSNRQENLSICNKIHLRGNLVYTLKIFFSAPGASSTSLVGHKLGGGSKAVVDCRISKVILQGTIYVKSLSHPFKIIRPA